MNSENNNNKKKHIKIKSHKYIMKMKLLEATSY